MREDQKNGAAGTVATPDYFENQGPKNTKFNPDFGNDILSLNGLDKHIKELVSSNEFPVEALPKPLQEIVKNLHEALNFPTAFTAAALLSAASTAIGHTHISVWKWPESGCLFMALVGNPGTNKTHPITFAYAPVVERDRLYYAQFKEENAAYDAANAAFLKDKKNQGDPPQKPILKKHLISDCTIEALAKVLQNNSRGICSHTDELAGWVGDFNKYSGGNGDIQKWLSMWSGQPIVVDRSSAPPIRIDAPFVNVIGTIQPGVIDDLARDNRNKNGFLDRILFVKPKGLKRHGWNTNELDYSVRSSWFLIMNKLLDLDFTLDQDGNEIPNKLWLTSEAKEVLLKWQYENVEEDAEFSSEIRDGVSAKIEIYVLRFALILQLIRYATGEGLKDRVEAPTVQNAILIAKYFKDTALEIADYLGSRCPIDRLPEIKRSIYGQLPKNFTTSQGKTILEAVNATYPESNRIGERALEYFLNEKNLFKRVSHGHYQKIFE